MTDTEWEWYDPDPPDTVYANSRGEIEALAETLDAVASTKIYVGRNPHNGLASDTLYNLDDWR